MTLSAALSQSNSIVTLRVEQRSTAGIGSRIIRLGSFRKILDQHGVPEVQLVAGDVTRIDDARLSRSYSVILLDIDLADPTYAALKRFWPRMTEGGAIYVDDCPEGQQLESTGRLLRNFASNSN